MADVFISYKREDRSLVRPLVRALQERGFTVWWDSRIETGANWQACIKRALDNAACIVVLWTPQSVRSDRTYVSEMVAVEASEGWGRGVLLPVRMQNGLFAFPHNLRQAEDLTDWQGNADDPALARLAQAIAKHCGDRSPPEIAELGAWLRAEDANNADIYRCFARTYPNSRFAPEVEPRSAEIEHRVADVELSMAAAARIVGQFSAEIRKPSFTPPIPLAIITRENAMTFTTEELFERLGQGSRVVLQAAPGGGKTVTLLEWALGYSASGPERVGVFLRLREVANTGDELVAHIARLESTGQVSQAAWQALARSGILTVFCDGWNELSDHEREIVGTKLDIFSRGYPSAGLVVGSRPVAPPALKGEHLLLSLQQLTYEQVRTIVEHRLGEKAGIALTELRQSRPLRDLVRTPFFLSAFCETRLAGAAPTTRESLIRGMIVAGEQRAEHAAALRRVLGGQQGKYLRVLAVEMAKRQQAELDNDDARRTVSREAMELHERGLIASPDNPGIILDTLRDHHCLIEHAGDVPSFRFQHQLISEWYASDEVRRIALRALSDAHLRATLDREILDDTVWEEAVLFAVERPDDNKDGVAAISHLILRTIGIDPEFAADLIAVAPPEVWERIKTVVRSFLEEWKFTAKRHAVRFAVRCGKADFSEIVWDAIAAEMSGRAMGILRVHQFPNPRVLGPDWGKRCAALSAKGREGLLTMLASNSGLEGAAMAVEAAARDKEAKVQAAVVDMLDFYRFQEELAELLKSAHPETWEIIVRKRAIDGLWDGPWRSQAIAAAHRIFSRLAPGPERIDWALRLKDLGEDVDIDLISELLRIKFEDHSSESSLFARVASIDGDRLSAALTEMLIEGHKVPYYASKFIKSEPPIDQARLLKACRTSSRFPHQQILSSMLSMEGLSILLSELLAIHAQARTAAGKARSSIAEKYHVVQDALALADKSRLAEVILNWRPAAPAEIGQVSDLLMRAYRDDHRRDERVPIRPELRERLIERLTEWASQVVSEPSCSRHTLHSVAEAIATFPSTGLLVPLRRLLSEDLNRWRTEKEKFKTEIALGKRPEPASGAHMSYAFRYGQNMLSLATGRDPDIVQDEDDEREAVISHEMTDAVIDVASGFLLDHEFGEDASRVLANLRPDLIVKIGNPRQFMSDDLRVVPERRQFRAERGVEPLDPVAERVVDAIRELQSQGSPEALLHAVRLAQAAVRMSCGDNLNWIAELVVQHGHLEEVSRHMHLRLLFGHEVNAEIAERCLKQLDSRRDERRWEYDENWYKWSDLLVIMIFGGKPLEAVERLLTYEPRGRNHDEKRIVEALGLCGHPDALLALDQIRDRSTQQRIRHIWLAAVHAVGTAEAADRLLTTVLEMSEELDWHENRTVSGMIAGMTNVHPSLRQRLMDIAERGGQTELTKLASIVRSVDSEEFVVDLLGISGDRLRILGEAIADALRDLCVEYRPRPGSTGISDVEPRAVQKLRASLFARAMANDSGSDVCMRLLDQIDQIRDDYGMPAEESRHPNIALERPWPTAARIAWQGSEVLAART